MSRIYLLRTGYFSSSSTNSCRVFRPTFASSLSRRLSLPWYIPPTPRRPSPHPYRSLTTTDSQRSQTPCHMLAGTAFCLACQPCLNFLWHVFLLSKSSACTNHRPSYHEELDIISSYLSGFKVLSIRGQIALTCSPILALHLGVDGLWNSISSHILVLILCAGSDVFILLLSQA